MFRSSLVVGLLTSLLVRGAVGAVEPQLLPFGSPEEYTRDLADRRMRTMAALGSDSVLVLWSAPPRVYSADTNYPYRQESNLLYLTGLEQADTTLVLVPGARTHKALLFVRRPDPLHDLWTGRTLTAAEVTSRSGVDAVFLQDRAEKFELVMKNLLAGEADPTLPGVEPGEFATFTGAVREHRARLAVVARLGPEDPEAGLGPDGQSQAAWARDMESKFPGVKAVSAARVLLDQRRVKTAYEQSVLRRSVEISAESHVEAMRATKPGVWEYQIKATLEYGFLSRGALSWGYPPIVGGGSNATVLHYPDATSQLVAGELVLADAAGSYQHLTGDITRTWPVSGRFSAPQREVYEVVLKAQEAGIAAARPGRSVDDVVAAVRESLGEGLTSLGLVRATNANERDAQIDLWFPHGPVHGIGMDVHEPIDRLDPGSAFVIEPGVYVRADAFDRLADSAARASYRETVRAAFERYRDIGVRIEDSFIMSTTAPLMLSGRAPRTPEAIERVIGRGR